MTHIHALFQLARADVLERSRRSSFAVALLVVIAVTWLFIPPLDAAVSVQLNLGGYRPRYSSAWIGTAVALLMGEVLPLFGFYLVKGSIERDRLSGVGAIIATTPISRATYLLGTWFGHLALLATFLVGVVLAAAALQLLRAEDRALSLWALAAPVLLVLFPALAFVAAIAVLFESLPVLRGGLGNVVYFGLYMLCGGFGDLQGNAALWTGVQQACNRVFDGCLHTRQIEITAVPLATLPAFTYTELALPPGVVLSRALWLLAGAVLVLLAALPFHRFDPARAVPQGAAPAAGVQADEAVFLPASPQNMLVAARSLPAATLKLRGLGHICRLVVAELMLTRQQLRWWWYVGATALIGAGLLVRLELAHMVVLPVAWLWPLLIWSALGARESDETVRRVALAAPSPRRQLMARWLAGTLVALALGGGVLLRLGLAGNWAAAVAVLVGALFVPALALALGCWSGGGKLFEIVYLMLWYLVTIQGIAPLDFMGRGPGHPGGETLSVFAGLTILLLAATLCRQRGLN